MDIFSVDAEKRTACGTAEVRRLKSEGLIPGILYGYNGSIPISLDQHDLSLLIDRHGPDVLLDLKLDGSDIKVFIKEIQRAPVSQDILHIDLMPVEKGILH